LTFRAEELLRSIAGKRPVEDAGVSDDQQAKKPKTEGTG
jgi:hypothetical protein